MNSYRSQDKTYLETWANRDIKQINISLELCRQYMRTSLQRSKKGEAKLIRCLQGKIWDVAVDLEKIQILW